MCHGIVCLWVMVLSRITNFLNSSKGRDVGIIALVLLVGLASFGLGRLSALEQNQPEVMIEYPNGVSGSGKIPILEEKGKKTSSNTSPQTNVAALGVANEGGAVVGSRSGTVYHLPWCSGAERIKEENKVWFASPEAARAAGYRPAGKCKGLQ